ncbi:RNA-dependent RNA polymerase [Wenzhou Shrimp Virus 1]|uniref:RNA-directed RNA polymerase L n=1 Tax=Wenzhou Shrimp Virus 1 TaxID=1608095 RepID=A0A0B5KRY7_9VIRU|nr:RNA-dependent RNA polymerase [Wenzhou Shrimp Virus 1]AJG39256.1 RNA-dependent RNA polymerase [Wenzhou Shrimp Virus 1]
MENWLRELETSNDAVYVHNPSTIFEPTETPELLSYEIKNWDPVAMTQVEIEFDDRPDEGTGSTLATQVISVQRVRTFLHDFTYSHISHNTDMRLDSVFRRMGTRGDNLTPDVILQDGNKILVVEFATTRGGDAALERSFRTKTAAYDFELRERAENRSMDHFDTQVFYGIIVTNELKVCSNLPLTEEQVNELVFRYRMAIDIQAELGVLGVSFHEEDDEMSQTSAEVKTILRNIPLSFHFDDKYVTREVYENSFGAPDSEYLKTMISTLMSDGRKKDLATGAGMNFCDEDKRWEGPSITKNLNECLSSIKKYERDLMEGERQHSSTKAIVQLPAWVAKRESHPGSTSVNYIDVGDHPSAAHAVWKNAMFHVLSRQGFKDDDEQEILMTEEENQDHHKPHRAEYHRVDLTLEDHVRSALAVNGVYGKEFKRNERVLAQRSEKRKPLSYSVDCSCVDTFISDNSLHKTLDTPIHEDLVRIISTSTEMHSNDSHQRECLKKFMSSILGAFSCIMTDVATELCISLKQHVKRNQMIIKKLRYYPIYMLIYPTDSSKHIFVSLLAEKDTVSIWDSSDCFKKTMSNDKVIFTDFVSFNSSKLANLCKLEATMYNTSMFWAEEHGEASFLGGQPMPWYSRDSGVRAEVWKMISLCLLISMSDKRHVEEQLSLYRYMNMEAMAIFPRVPQPYKMLKKMTLVPRSRLELWIIKRHLRYMKHVCSGYHAIKVKDDSGDSNWHNLINPYTLAPLQSISSNVNLNYIGYLCNKEETAEGNTAANIYEKILVLEDELPSSNEFLGLRDPVDPGYHEFSPSLLKAAVDNIKDRFRRVFGSSWEANIESKILRALGSITLEEMATLKASSDFSPKYYTLKPGDAYRRRKAIQGVRDLMDGESTQMYEVLSKCLTQVEQDGCMHIDIFKKPQHGGDREIYVMDINSRVVQLGLETIARTYCSFIDSEAMTHPKSKFKLPEEHERNAEKKLGTHVTFCQSADARKWSQGHHVSKFMQMLCRLTPNYMHGFIVRACALWTKRRILISPALIKIFCETPSFTSENDIVQRMYNGYAGLGTEKWISQGQSFIQVGSGMMQGILHYTSSLLHSIFQEFLRSLLRSHYRSRELVIGEPMITVGQSSDDSYIMVTFKTRDSETWAEAALEASMMHHLKSTLSKFLGIYDSEKTASMLMSVLEFLSEYMEGSSLHRATVKSVFACLSISEHESLSSRQEEMSTLLTKVVEDGGSINLASHCQIGQALLHYRLIGSSVSPAFNLYCSGIFTSKDPALGFFLMDHPFTAGLLGFKYNLWNACVNSSLGKKYKRMLIQPLAHRPLEATSSGTLLHSYHITWGNRKKWERLVRSLELPEDWREMIEQDPVVLYRKARTEKDLELRLAEKVHSPGVCSSLSKGNAVTRIISGSVYILTRNVMSVVGDKSKISLIKAILDERSEIEPLSWAEESLLFPSALEYHSISVALRKVDSRAGVFRKHKDRRKRSNIQITDSDGDYLFQPDVILAWRWFNIDRMHAAMRVKEKMFQKLQQALPWVKDTPEETVEQSPFENQIQLHTFLTKTTMKRREVHLLGTEVTQRGGVSSLLTAVYQNHFPGYHLQFLKDEVAASQSSEYSKLAHFIHMTHLSPYPDDHKHQLIVSKLASSPQIEFKEKFGRSRRNCLAIIQKSLALGISDLLDQITFSYKMGVVGGFVKRQKSQTIRGKVVYTGTGTWVGSMDGVNMRVTVEGTRTSNHVMSIVVSNPRAMYTQTFGKLLQTWMKEMGVTEGDPQVKPNVVAYYRNGHIYQGGRGGGGGVPIFHSLHGLEVFEPRLIQSVDIQVKNNTVRLVAGYGTRHISNMTILSYTTRDKDSTLTATRADFPEIKPAMQYWYANSSWPSDMALGIINKALTGVLMPNADQPAVQQWLQTLFRNSAERKGLLEETLDLPIGSITSTVVPEVFDDFWDLVDFGEPENLEEFGEAVPSWEDFDFEMSFGGANISNLTPGVLRTHPLLDSLVGKLVRDLSMPAMSKLVRDKVGTPAMHPLVALFAYLMGVDQSEIAIPDWDLVPSEAEAWSLV